MNVIKNYIYNALYQIMLLLIPVITMPYLTRIFLPEQLGLNTYTLSIANYFMLFGMLGMQMYGNRQIAYVRDKKKTLSETFWSLYSIQLVTCIISLIVYYLFIELYICDNKLIYLIQGLNIVSVLLDISWLFMGLEDFKKVVIRNTIAKIIGLISIFIFIKDSGDLNTYIFINACINIISILIMWVYVPKCVGKISINRKIIKKTIKPLFMLFLPQIATQVYVLLARTMVGVLSTNEQVAFYDYSQKIVRMVLSLITSIGIVLLPRISNIVGNGYNSQVPKIIERIFGLVSYISIPMSIGLMCISKILVSWFLGVEYFEVGKLSAVTSLIIVAVSWANIIGVQYLIAIKEEGKYTISIIIAAIINLIMNLLFIGKYGAMGAVVSLIIAEYTGVVIQMYLVRNQLPIVKMLKGTFKYLVAALIMAVIVVLIGNVIKNAIITNIVQCIVGITIYMLIMYIIKDESQKEIIEKITSILKKS